MLRFLTAKFQATLKQASDLSESMDERPLTDERSQSKMVLQPAFNRKIFGSTPNGSTVERPKDCRP